VTVPPACRGRYGAAGLIEVDLEPEPCGGRDRGRPPGANGVDDLAGIDALQIGRGGSEVGVTKLALDDVDRDPFTGELDGVCVSELVVVPTSAQALLSRPDR